MSFERPQLFSVNDTNGRQARSNVPRVLQVSFERPQLFPKTTMQQLEREHVYEGLDRNRAAICHPLQGIYTDADWAAFKEKCGFLSSEQCPAI